MKVPVGFVEVVEPIYQDMLEGPIQGTIAGLQLLRDKWGELAEIEYETDYDGGGDWQLHYLRPETETETAKRLVRVQKAAIRKTKQKLTAGQRAAFKKEEARIAAVEAEKAEQELFLKLMEKYGGEDKWGNPNFVVNPNFSGNTPANSTENMF